MYIEVNTSGFCYLLHIRALKLHIDHHNSYDFKVNDKLYMTRSDTVATNDVEKKSKQISTLAIS